MVRICKQILPLLAAICLLLSGCKALSHEADRRANDFVRALIEVPTDTKKLIRLANVADMDALQRLTDPIEVSVVLRYLRVSAKLGKRLRYSTKTLQHADAYHHTARIKIRRQRSDGQPPDVLLLYVTMTKDRSKIWRISRIRVPDLR